MADSTKITPVGLPLYNIVKAEIITQETAPKIYSWETASKVNAKPKISQGSEDILRVKNRIIAKNKFEDLVTGYEIDFEDNVFLPEVFALVDGGTLTSNAGKAVKYEGPASGSPVNRLSFDIKLYTEEKDSDSSTKSYACFTVKNCKGKPAEFSIEDGKVLVPKLTMESSPKVGEKPVSIDFMDKLPA